MEPNIKFKKSIEKDVAVISGFVKEKESLIFESFPEFGNKEGEELLDFIPGLVKKIHLEEKNNFTKKICSLQKSEKKIVNVCKLISKIIETSWAGYKNIDVYLSICPIAPRFLKERYFLLPIYGNNSESFNIVIHELIHFLYFKKWHKIFGDSYSLYEYPHKIWILSEILDPVIMNDKRIVKITKYKAGLYPQWDIYEKKYNLLSIFEEIYIGSNNFSDFLKKAKYKYNELDRKWNLTVKLTK